MQKRKHVKAWLLDFLFTLAGAAVYAVSVNAFTRPNQIAAGGMTGIGTMLNYLFQIPIGTVVLLLNIPIVLWGIFEIGYKLIAKSIVAIICMSTLIDLFALFVPAYRGDHILVALFAGVLEGLGLSIVFLRGVTTGGTDMIARLLKHRFRHIPMGKLMLAIDGIIVAVSGLVFGSIENAMYACIVIFVSTSIIDAILYGADSGTGKTYFILSPKNQEIADRIMTELDRGVTLLDSRGGYSKEKGEMILCAVRRYEVHQINEIIRGVDRNAFVIVGDAGEISGEGFKPTKSDDKSIKDLIRHFSEKRKVKATEVSGETAETDS